MSVTDVLIILGKLISHLHVPDSVIRYVSSSVTFPEENISTSLMYEASSPIDLSTRYFWSKFLT